MSENLQRTCNELATDCISRQGAIDAIADYLSKTTYTSAISYLNTGAMILARVPSAERKGKWVYLDGLDAFECSVCGRQMVRNIFDYCPWCGARMERREE